MELLDIVRRAVAPEPWAEGDNIPWDEPGFSARMLREHLSQEHDAASRRAALIDAHVAWIHDELLGGQPGRVLDLGCGPGLYTARLAALGHACVGIDFSPASIAYAEARAREEGLDCTYRLGDIRTTAYGAGYQLVLLVFGELNVFRPEDARRILAQAHTALAPGGRLLLEVHTADAVRAMGSGPATWRAQETGLFSDRPHLRLDEPSWDEGRRAATQRYFVIDAATAAVTRYAQSVQAYTEEEYRGLLAAAGFAVGGRYRSLAPSDVPEGLFVLVGVAA